MTIDDETIRHLTTARAAAERIVEPMQEGSLKEKAFELILGHLLAAERANGTPAARPTKRSAKRKPPAPEQKKPRRAAGPRRYLEQLVADGFLDTPRALPDILAHLVTRGHTGYQQQDLSKPIQRLTQAGVLRREKKDRNGGRTIWYYQTA